jgi:hypothetical protein
VTPHALLSRLIESSGLSILQWARTVAGVDHRTVRRWLAGDPIPESRAMWLASIASIRRVGTRIVVEHAD